MDLYDLIAEYVKTASAPDKIGTEEYLFYMKQSGAACVGWALMDIDTVDTSTDRRAAFAIIDHPRCGDQIHQIMVVGVEGISSWRECGGYPEFAADGAGSHRLCATDIDASVVSAIVAAKLSVFQEQTTNATGTTTMVIRFPIELLSQCR